jgi:hypothetical protein
LCEAAAFAGTLSVDRRCHRSVPLAGEERLLPCGMLEGSCHCGAITVRLETALAPHELPVRICGCTFCAKHRPRYTSDPAGRATITLAAADSASRYRFGLGLADFLVCRTCGVFVAAYDPAGRAVINLEALARAAELTAAPTQFTAYDTEDAEARLARRARNWTPATVVTS